jgi:hypothetical protein
VIEGSATLALAIREPVIALVIATLFGINQPLGVEVEPEVAQAALAVAAKLVDSAETEEAETRMVDIVHHLLEVQADVTRLRPSSGWNDASSQRARSPRCSR